MKAFTDLSGQKFHRLTVVSYAGKSPNKMFTFLCRCDCGTEKVFRGNHLVRGEVKSCGCYRRETSAAKIRLISTTHGHAADGKSPTYESWTAMKARCGDVKHPAFHRYGGRGIMICDRWSIFENFLEDMGERPEGKTLDRKENDLGYSKDNCQWSTGKVQSRNRSNNHVITHDGKTMCLSEWAERVGIKKTTIRERLRRGWTANDALTPL